MRGALRGAVLLAAALAAAGAAAQEGPDPAPLLDEAARAHGSGRYADAERALRRVETEAGGLPAPGRLRLAEVLRDTGRLEEALAEATLAADAAPGDPRPAVLRGTLLRERGRFAEAEAALRAAGERFPGSPAAMTALGDVFRETGRAKEALRAYEAANDLWASADVTGPEDLVAVARARFAIFEMDAEVDRALQSTLEILGDAARAGSDEAHVLIARAYALNAQTEKVGPAVKRVLDRNPRHPGALAVQAWSKNARYESREAGALARDALLTDPTQPDAVEILAGQRLGDGDDAGAVELLDRALAARPAHRMLRAIRAVPLYLSGDAKAYEEAVKAILATDPTFGHAYAVLARVLEERRRFDEAARFARRAVEIDPGDAAAWFALGRALLDGGHEAEAKEALETSNRVDPWRDVFRENFRTVLAELDGYVAGSTKNFVLAIHPDEDAALRPLYERALEESLADLARLYDFTPEGPILVEVFRRAADFSARTVGVPGFGAIGACFGRVVTLDSPGALPAGAFCWRSTAHHELAHVFSLQMSRGRVPRWLTEGLAVHEEKRANASWDRNMDGQLVSALANGEVKRIADIDGTFRGPEILWGYYQGGLMCEWMEREFGWPRVLRMLRLYAEDLSTTEVVKRALGVTPEEFDRGFLAHCERRVAGWHLRPRWSDARLAEFRERSNRDAADLEAHLGYAEAALQRGNTFDAGTPLSRAVALQPANPRVLALRGRTALGSDRNPARGLDLLREALAAGEQDFALRMTLAGDALKRGAADEAEEHLRAAKLAFPRAAGSDGPRALLFRLYTGAGRVDDALREAEEAVAIDETDLRMRGRLARLYEDRGETEKAERVLAAMVDIRPLPGPMPPDGEVYDAVDVLARLGRARMALGRPADAVIPFRVAVAVRRAARDPSAEEELANLHVELGRAARAAGAAEEARSAAREALRLRPDHPGALLLLKDLDTR